MTDKKRAAPHTSSAARRKVEFSTYLNTLSSPVLQSLAVLCVVVALALGGAV